VTAFRRSRLDLAMDAATSDEGAEPPLLDAALASRLEARFVGSFSREAGLDGIDLVAAGVAGAVGAAVDLLVVAIPRDVTYLGRHPQRGSWLTKLFKSWGVPSNNALARVARVPFDAVTGDPRVPGMFPGNHRFMTPGHDPLLGFVVGVFDILRGGRTAIGTDGAWRFDGGLGEPCTNVAAAVALEVLHLLSDVVTPAGLPAPFATALGLLRVGSFGKQGRTVADLTRYMYLEGYDLRHFVTTCSAPAAIRMVLQGYFLGRRCVDDAYRADTDASARRDARPLDHLRLGTMTFYADAVACAANAGKVALYQGNPAAFSYGEWLSLLRSASRFTADRLERPTEVLLDRAAANEEALRVRWKQVRGALGLGDLGEASEVF
jgi:hypothetical protein